MEQYIIVKVRDAKACFPEKTIVHNGTVIIPHSNLAKVRRAIHDVCEEQFISAADIVSHSIFMTKEETETINRIFNDAMGRAKETTITRR